MCESCPFDKRCKTPPVSSFVFKDVFDSSDIEINTCPRHHAKTSSMPIENPFHWAKMLESGVLPVTGGMHEQPNIYAETMEIISALKNYSKREQRLKMEDETKPADKQRI